MPPVAAALKVLHKLMAYEIITMSSFHAAAMMGHNDIIVALLDKVKNRPKGFWTGIRPSVGGGC